MSRLTDTLRPTPRPAGGATRLLSVANQERASRIASPGGRKADTFEEVIQQAASIWGGISVHQISLNSLLPFKDGPVSWDLMSYPTAILRSNFDRYLLPDPSVPIVDYAGIEGLEFDATAPVNSRGPRIPAYGQYNSYALRARAVVIAPSGVTRMSDAVLSGILTADCSLGYEIAVDIVGAGTFSQGAVTATGTGKIQRRVAVNGSLQTVEEPYTVDVAVEPEYAYNGALVDLTFLSVSGAPWTAIAVRLS